jgi:hypothetical protein
MARVVVGTYVAIANELNERRLVEQFKNKLRVVIAQAS